MKLYVFIYFLDEDRAKTLKSLGRHVSYWKGRKFEYFKNGPFADRSGGMIIFSAGGIEAARAIVADDPLLLENAIHQHWLKEWVP